MTPRASDLHEAWIVLKQGANTTAMRTYDSGITVDQGPVLLGIDNRGCRHLLVPVGAEDVEPDTSSGGVHLIETTLQDGGTTRRFADLWCLAPHLDAVFERFCLDVLERIEVEPTLPAATCFETLGRWREFLLPDRGALLGRDSITGLYGELLVLSELLEHDAGALSGWVGPLERRHDFRLPGASIEVKTTTARSGHAAHINGHDQLEPDVPRPLLLVWHRIEVGAASGETLPELIDRISGIVVDRLRFNELLDRVGYRHDDAYAYPDRIALLERIAFRVEGEFPRLVSTSFVGSSPPPGVSRIGYVIQLPTESREALDPEATKAALVSAVIAAG